MLNIAMISAFLLCTIAAGAMTYVIYRRLKKMDRQIGVGLKSQYISVRELRSVGYKLDSLDRDNKRAVEAQHKFNENQRVMLASLNRQIMHLDGFLSRSSRQMAETTPKQMVEKPSRTDRKRFRADPLQVNRTTPRQRTMVPVSSIISKNLVQENSDGDGVAFLEELFANRTPDTSPQSDAVRTEAAELTSRFSKQLADTEEHSEPVERRVSYG